MYQCKEHSITFLFFGRQTTAAKGHSQPSVFVLKSQASNSTAACLAKDFYPKDVEIYLNSSKQSIGPVEAKSILSMKGKYSAIQVGELGAEDVHCQAKHQGEWVTEDVVFDAEVVYTARKDNTTVAYSIETEGNERANLLSMEILGMRLLFAKMMSFNLLVSVKVFIT
uniref:Immunoglobulin C1-set domain-containing protein n=1 Tax=Leptobrachium leishanense TaxID=445787 RepID=A0A8C5M7E9_9ANUR